MPLTADEPAAPLRWWRRWELIVPCLLIVIYASPLVFYRVPANSDTLDESYEPLKTFKFFHSRGRAFHKWGPMPSFVYAPVYAAPMAYWFATGGLGRVSEDYPYGFTRPHEQTGLLIVLARLVGLAAGVASTVYLGSGLLRLTGSSRAAFLALLLCIATSPNVVVKYVATKPDGLMLAFLAASMVAYARIVAGGLTRARGVALSAFAVASISCKELTAPAFILPYLGIAVSGWLGSRGDPKARRRFLADYALTIGAGLAAYTLLNVVYAPTTWLERMHEWLLGPGKDPAVWASSGATKADYLLAVLRGLLVNFDGGGLATLALSALASLALPVRRRVMLWLPTVGFLAIVVLTAGYMPAYFLLPVNITAALPVAASLAALGRVAWPRPVRLAGAGLLVALAAFNVLGGNAAWALASTQHPSLLERYCLESVERRDLIFLGNLYARQPGYDRLSYLGFNVDDRPLGAIMERPGRMPDLILDDREHIEWMADLIRRPARNEMLKETGYSYDRFRGYESLGYRLDEVVRPRPPWPIHPAIFPWYRPSESDDLVVYRRVPDPEPGR